ncbi:hypothetical protein NUSPORA_01960 [Nucleospora cyclopteri]
MPLDEKLTSIEASETESITDIDNISSSNEEETTETVHSEKISTEEDSEHYRRHQNTLNYRQKSAQPYFVSQNYIFQQSPEEQFSSKNKAIAFIEKDLFVVTHYEPSPFKNIAHAVESVTPYHIFNQMVDDLKFKGSTVNVNLSESVAKIRTQMADFANEVLVESNQTSSFVAQLLLFHEQRYFLSKIDHAARKSITQRLATNKKHISVKKSKKRDFRNKKSARTRHPGVIRKKRTSKDKFVLVFKRPEAWRVYGNIHKMHFKLDYSFVN